MISAIALVPAIALLIANRRARVEDERAADEAAAQLAG